MKTFLSTIAATVLLSNAVAAQQEPSNTVKKLSFVANCDQTKKVISNLTTVFNEKPIVDGQGAVLLANGELLQGYTVITGNSETASYSVTMNFDNGYTCILTFGKQIAPYDSSK